MDHRTRLRQYALQRWLLRLLLLGGALLLLGAAAVTLDKRTMPGLRVAGVPVERTKDPLPLLRARAAAWGQTKIRLISKPHVTTATRAELGGRLDADAMAARMLALGHSGNPLVDLWTWQHARRHGIELAWPAHIDRALLGRYVRAVRNVVERPPVAGTVDQEGLTLAGVPGVTLDVVLTADELERLLRSNGLETSVDLREVPAPQIEIGSPDGIDEEQREQADAEAPRTRGNTPGRIQAQLSAAMLQRMHAAEPRSWLPPQGCEAMDPPYEHFCQGPRRVPAPHGASAEAAEKLDLGTLLTVGRLLSAPPRAAWVAAAGGPVPSADMLWPVPQGRLWRRFGYVRRAPFEHMIHRSFDIGAARGTPLYAVNPGIVAYSDNRVRGYGNLLVIVHPDASVTFSAHCRAIYVFAGQQVERGQIVGEVGDTGLARGPHVHWEYHMHGKAADPEGLFSRAKAD